MVKKNKMNFRTITILFFLVNISNSYAIETKNKVSEEVTATINQINNAGGIPCHNGSNPSLRKIWEEECIPAFCREVGYEGGYFKSITSPAPLTLDSKAILICTKEVVSDTPSEQGTAKENPTPTNNSQSFYLSVLQGVLVTLLAGFVIFVIRHMKFKSHEKQIVEFLKNSENSTEYKFRTTHAISSNTNLTEEQVRVACSKSKLVRRNEKEEETWAMR